MKKIYCLLIVIFFSSISLANESKTIVIKAKNGKVVELKDSTDLVDDGVSDSHLVNYLSYSIDEINSIYNYAIITEWGYEGHGNALLSLDSGKYTNFSGYPYFSSTGKHIVVANVDLAAGYTDNALKIYRVEAGNFILEYDAKPSEKWGPSSVKWLSPTVVEFTEDTYECYMENLKPCAKYLVTYQNKIWIKQLVK